MSSKSFARNNLAKNPENAYEPDTADDSDHLVSPKQKRKKKKKRKKSKKRSSSKISSSKNKTTNNSSSKKQKTKKTKKKRRTKEDYNQYGMSVFLVGEDDVTTRMEEMAKKEYHWHPDNGKGIADPWWKKKKRGMDADGIEWQEWICPFAGSCDWEIWLRRVLYLLVRMVRTVNVSKVFYCHCFCFFVVLLVWMNWI